MIVINVVAVGNLLPQITVMNDISSDCEIFRYLFSSLAQNMLLITEPMEGVRWKKLILVHTPAGPLGQKPLAL